MGYFLDAVQMTVSGTPGAGTITLGAAVAGYQSFATAGVVTGQLVSYAIQDVSGAFEYGRGTYTTSGTTLARTTVLGSSNGGSAINATSAAIVSATALAEDIAPIPYLRGFIGGLVTSNDSVAPNTVLDIAAGTCADSVPAVLINLGAFTKSTQGSWAAGSGSNGMGTGLSITASTWYYVFAIINGGVADVYFDTSTSAANAPGGTTAYRRIGSFYSNSSSNIAAYTQIGNTFLWSVPVASSGNTASLGTSAISMPLQVPPAIPVEAQFNGYASSATAAAAVLLSSPYVSDENANAIVGNDNILIQAGTSVAIGGQFRLMTGTGAIRARASNASTTLDLAATGWVDTRGTFS